MSRHRIAAAARATLALVALLPPGRPRADDAARMGLRRSARARAAGVGEATQKQLDRLARRRRDLLQRVATGELSLWAALDRAGLVQRPPPRPLVPVTGRRVDLAAAALAVSRASGPWRWR